jgi:hypothetical protein
MEPKLKEQLAEFARTDVTARSFFQGAVGGEPDRTETPLDTLVSMLWRDGKGANRTDLIRVLRRLEEYGCGHYSEPHEGQPARFTWRVGLSEVARAALDTD